MTASDIIYHELKRFKANRKIPIVASIMDVGASGGYYIAAAADNVSRTVIRDGASASSC